MSEQTATSDFDFEWMYDALQLPQKHVKVGVNVKTNKLKKKIKVYLSEMPTPQSKFVVVPAGKTGVFHQTKSIPVDMEGPAWCRLCKRKDGSLKTQIWKQHADHLRKVHKMPIPRPLTKVADRLAAAALVRKHFVSRK